LGATGVQQGTDVVVRDPAIAAFRKRISITVQPSYSSGEALIEIVLRDGRVLTAHVLHCSGSAERPLTGDELSIKFLALVSPLLGEVKAQEIRLQCSEIETSEVSILAKFCAP
jgi:2-methylcitrate dehydratase PrpD